MNIKCLKSGAFFPDTSRHTRDTCFTRPRHTPYTRPTRARHARHTPDTPPTHCGLLLLGFGFFGSLVSFQECFAIFESISVGSQTTMVLSCCFDCFSVLLEKMEEKMIGSVEKQHIPPHFVNMRKPRGTGSSPFGQWADRSQLTECRAVVLDDKAYRRNISSDFLKLFFRRTCSLLLQIVFKTPAEKLEKLHSKHHIHC